jgi:hypothetical protein
VAEANQALGGARPVRPRQIADKAVSAAYSDSRIDSAVKAWRKCMKAAGYQYDSSLAALNFYQSRSDTPTDSEVTAAVADVQCKTTTREVDTMVAVLTAYELRAINENAEEFSAYKTWKTNALARAHEVIATLPVPANRHDTTPPAKSDARVAGS